jgi:RNA polymerase sigma-70 factor (ECF subfamily)
LFRGLGRADAEEAVNDAWIKIWDNAHKYVPREGVLAKFWLRSLMRYAVFDKFRDVKNVLKNEESAARVDSDGEFEGDDFHQIADEPWTDMSAPEQTVLGLEKSNCFDGCLSELSEGHRRTLELLFMGGQNESEIAHTTGQTLGTVKSRKHYAVGKMQVCVEHCVDGIKTGVSHG